MLAGYMVVVRSAASHERNESFSSMELVPLLCRDDQREGIIIWKDGEPSDVVRGWTSSGGGCMSVSVRTSVLHSTL